MARLYGARPSAILGIIDPIDAFYFDEAITLAYLKREKEWAAFRERRNRNRREMWGR